MPLIDIHFVIGNVFFQISCCLLSYLYDEPSYELLKSQCWLEISRLIIDTHSCTFMKVVPVATLLVCYHGISPLPKNNSNLVAFSTFSLYILPTFRCVSAFELVLMGTWIIDDAFTEPPKWIYEEEKIVVCKSFH